MCSAAFCVAVTDDNKVVLTKTERGWELLGGHLEENESIEQAIVREAQEEGGFTPCQYKLFGYRKVMPKQPAPNRKGGYYPFPVSYIPHYIATTKIPLTEHSGTEVIERRAVTFNEATALHITDNAILQAGLAALREFKKTRPASS